MAQIEANVQSTFATPIATVKIPDAAQLNERLCALFRERAAQGDDYRHTYRIPTQVGPLFESRFDLFAWPDAPVQELTQHIHGMLRQFVLTMNDYTEEQMAALSFQYESWFHITKKGGYQSIHFHPKHSWSGIYCVRAGEPVSERPESGAVKFYDPRGPAFMYWDAGNERLVEGFGNNPIYLNHIEGQIVMFPSFLPHEVLPYVGEGERIIVAFNAQVLPAAD